jgi:hypothetical protein
MSNSPGTRLFGMSLSSTTCYLTDVRFSPLSRNKEKKQ